MVFGSSVWMAKTVKKAVGEGVQLGTKTMGIGLFLTSISIIMLLLAVKSIKNDDKLVKSADRLR